MQWIDFDPAKGYQQPLPPERKLVMVQSEGRTAKGLPPSVSVGYLRFAAGEKDSPFFVVPGVERGKDVAWCDCLPEGFGAPLWAGYPHTTSGVSAPDAQMFPASAPASATEEPIAPQSTQGAAQ